MIKVDDIIFPNLLVQTLSRGFEIKEGSNSGYVLDGTHRRDVTGMYLSYTITLDSSFADLPEYDKFFEILSDVAESHTIEFPYGQDVLTFEAEITDGEDSLILHEDDYNLWQDFTFTFRSRRPIKRPITSIDREMIAIPTYSGKLVYNGETQSPTFEGYDSEKMFISGETSAINAGIHIAKFTPTVYYKWPDGEIGAKEVPWEIKKAELSLYVKPQTIKLTRPFRSDIITATYDGDGIVSAKSDNVGVCDVESVEGNTVRVTSDMSKSGDANIVVTVAEGTNYKSNQATCSVNVDNSKQPCNLKLSPSVVDLKKQNGIAHVTVYRDGDGEIVVEPDTTGVCNVSIDGNTITITEGTEVGETSIVVKCLETSDYLAEESSIFVSSGVGVWGVKIEMHNENPETAVNYINDAVGMTLGHEGWKDSPLFSKIRPCLMKNGIVQYYLNPDDLTKQENGEPAIINDITAGDVMVEIPRMGYKFESDSGYHYIRITNAPNQEGYCYRAHSLDTEGDCDYIYIGAFLGYMESNKLYSVSEKSPLDKTPINDFRAYAQARGLGYQLLSFYPLTLLQCLYLIKYKNRNGQQALGKGQCTAPSVKTGGTVSKGTDYGSQETEQMCFLNIEDFWGNYAQWIDGIFYDSEFNIKTAFKDFNNTGDGYVFSKNSGISSTGSFRGLISDIQATDESGFFMKENAGSTTTYYADQGNLRPNSCAIHGGGSNASDLCGPFYSSVFHGGTYWNTNVTSARLVCKHKEVKE